MRVLVQPRAYPPEFMEFFAPNQMDLGHEPEMISAIDEEWYSILVVDRRRVLAHAIAPKRIGDSDLYDVEPFLGYGGLLTNSNDQCFLREALAAYSGACRSLKVIAELIRFDPLLHNCQVFIDHAELAVIPAKRVVIVTCEEDYKTQVSHFAKSRRKELTKSLKNYQARTLDKSEEIGLFRNLYERSLARLGAEKRWLFSDRFYSAIVASSLFEIESIWSGNHLVAAILIGHHATASHALLGGLSDDHPDGASTRIIYEAMRNAIARGQRRLVLGGGLTAAPNDPLLFYKSHFAKETSTFFVGMMVHDRPNFELLQAQAIALRPEIQDRQFFLKHRLVTSSA